MEAELKRIIFVDDDPNALEGLRRMLHSVRSQWDLAFVTTAKEALSAMEEAPFDVVVSDMRMPDMDGADLLQTVSEKYPATIRFTLSGHADSQTLLKASTVSHKMLSKPCDGDQLRVLLSRALALRHHLKSPELRTTLTKVGALPTLPAIYSKILREMQSPEASIAGIAKIIEEDIGMSAKILQIVNSAFMGLRHQVASVLQAASLLGMTSIQSFVLTASIFSDAERHMLPKNFNLDTIWNQCLKVAAYAKAITLFEDGDKDAADQAFMAGLLHEVGQIILATRMPETYQRAIELAGEKRMTIEDAEREVFGSTNAEVGGFLLELWGIPDAIVEAITFQYYPSALAEVAGEFCTLTALHVASFIAQPPKLLANALPKAELDSEYLDSLGMGEKIEVWWDECSRLGDAKAK